MTETVKHTPGPWAVERDHDGTLHIASGAWPVGHLICSIDPRDGGDNDANASLIAAAPEMLEALRNALATGLPDVVANAVRAAIAKAEGRNG